MATIETASKYINNLLLARGLLPDGKCIDFHQKEVQSEITESTISRTINLIHDLILRRDREFEQHETIAATIKNLRAVETQHVLQIQQLQDNIQQSRADVQSAQSQARSARTEAKKFEIQVKELKEQNLRMKSKVDQVRAKCISDVRKREVEIEKLKSHLVGLQRGKKDSGGMKIHTLNCRPLDKNKKDNGRFDVANTELNLDNETNDFLAALVNETTSENVTLRQIISDTQMTLKEMTGHESGEVKEEEDAAIGIPGQYRLSRQVDYEKLVSITSITEQMDAVLRRCRSILKDPSFVPIEEVQIRDEEIIKLRAGWEKMADRWKEAVTMMSQWRQRMTDGKSLNNIDGFEEFSFGRSVAIRPDGRPVFDNHSELSGILEDCCEDDQSDLHMTSDTVVQPENESDLELEPGPLLKHIASSPARRGIRLLPNQPQISEIAPKCSIDLATNCSSEVEIESFATDEDIENRKPEIHLDTSMGQINKKRRAAEDVNRVDIVQASIESKRRKPPMHSKTPVHNNPVSATRRGAIR